ncbi:hypothetical protein Leryth_010513 [Lithospermum erythrorhizon]|nr:hypothetical protein Leryth_010513 [Lithospermum erythrorhizon]
MERYTIIKEVGNGTFGSVWRALNKQTGEVVAIKKMKKKYYSWEECVNLREVKSLRKMNHSNIVKLKEEINLYELMKEKGKPFSEVEVRNWCYQVLQGLSYMHQRGYFHRDLKPENLLVSKDVIKIADFGLAREIDSKPPYTEYVSTRWYRAPEVLLQSPIYNAAVDMWAMGAIMAELFSLRPLFPEYLIDVLSCVQNLRFHSSTLHLKPDGLQSLVCLLLPLLAKSCLPLRDQFVRISCEADEVYKICSVLGTPSRAEWGEGLELASAINYQFPQVAGVHLSLLIPSASKDAINLIASLCSWDPCKRPTVMEALQHPFFQSCYYVPPSLRVNAAVTRTPPSVSSCGLSEKTPGRRYSTTLMDQKSSMSCNLKAHAAVSAGMKRNLEIKHQETLKNENSVNYSVSQHPPYRPPPMINKPIATYMGGNAYGVSDAADKFSNLTFGSNKPPAKHPSLPPPLKAGGWHHGSRQNDLFHFHGRSQENLGAKIYSRKVAG